MVRRPRATHYDLNSRQMAARHLVAVLIFLHLLVVDEVGNVDQHVAGLYFAAADVLVERIKDLIHLDRKGAGLGLALSLS